MAVRQRMIRAGSWKLSYYHGYRPQLFDLASDPHELVDLATDDRYAAIRDGLVARVFADWDPLDVDRRMRRRAAQKALLGAWARATHPQSSHLWRLTPDQNALADMPSA